MSLTFMLFLVALAASIVVFGDIVMQWSLRLVLNGGLDRPRAKTEASEPAPASEAPVSPATAA